MRLVVVFIAAALGRGHQTQPRRKKLLSATFRGLATDEASAALITTTGDPGRRRLTGDTWSPPINLFASDGAAFDYFGYSVALSGGVLAVGAYGDNDAGTDSGAVYVFDVNGDPSSWPSMSVTS